MNNPFRHKFESERVFVLDENGYVESDPQLVWANPQLYIWTNSAYEGNELLHFFRFNG